MGRRNMHDRRVVITGLGVVAPGGVNTKAFWAAITSGRTVRLESEYLVLSDSGREWVLDDGYTSPHLYDYYMPGSIATELAWEVNAQGPAAVVSAGCTSGLDSIGHAVDLIREGIADVM